MHRHLVTVEVGVVGRTNERVNANGFAFDQLGLKGLNGEPVQRGRTVEHDRMALGDLFQNIPNFRCLPLN